MYKCPLDKTQEVINILQHDPYKDVSKLIGTITQSQKDGEGNYLFSYPLHTALTNYLQEKSFAQVYTVINILNSLEESVVTEPIQKPEFSEKTVG
jgi:hypothetical protein